MLTGSSFAGRSRIRMFFSMGQYKTLLSNALLLCVQWHRTLLNSCACSSQAIDDAIDSKYKCYGHKLMVLFFLLCLDSPAHSSWLIRTIG